MVIAVLAAQPSHSNALGEDLISAVRYQMVERVDAMLRAGADPNAGVARAGSPAGEATVLGEAAVAHGSASALTHLLLSHGAEVDGRDAKGRTPLWRAAERGQVRAARALIAAGADLQAAVDGKGVLDVAFGRSVPLLEELVDRGARALAPPSDNLVCSAAGNGDLRQLGLLLRAGGSPDAFDSRMPALLRAVSGGHVDAVALLLSAGADPNARRKVHSGEGSTPKADGTALAAAERESLPLLLSAGADPNFAAEDGQAALMVAAAQGKAWKVKALLAAGARADAVDPDGRTALHWAMQALPDGPAIRRMLLDAGAPVNAGIGRSGTPLHEAARHGTAAALRELLAAGAEVNAPAADGTTPLLIAARRWNPRAVEVLLQAGANPDATDSYGQTAAELAARDHRFEVIDLLSAAGGDRQGRLDAALAVIVQYGPTEMVWQFTRSQAVDKLLSLGASPNARTRTTGERVLCTARRGKQDELEARLLAAGASPRARNRDGTRAGDCKAERKHIWLQGLYR